MRNLLRAGLLAAAACLLPACIEADVETEIRADGSGTMGVSMKFTEKFVEILRRLEKVDPDQDTLKEASGMLFDRPDAAAIAEAEKAGMKLLEFESVRDEKRMSAKAKVEFATLASLQCFDRLVGTKDDREKASKGKGDSPADDMRLTRDAEGVYTLSLSMEPGDDGGDEDDGEDGEEDDGDGEDDGGDDDGGEMESGGEPAPAAPGTGEAKPADPEAEAKKVQEVMAIMGEMMGEASRLRFTVALKVPGEILDFEPAAGGKKEEGKVTWNLDFGTMMAASMGGKDGGMKGMQVRFRMPAGQSLPEKALWDGPAKKPAPAAREPGPAAPPGQAAPEGEPK